METWKLLLITLLSAVVLGCVIGIVTGKQMLKRARGNYKPLLSPKERIIYALCMVVGAVCIAVGLYFIPQAGNNASPMGEGGMVDGGMMMNPEANGLTDDEGQAPDGMMLPEDEEPVTEGEIETDAPDSEATEPPIASDAETPEPDTQIQVAVARSLD